MKKRSKKPELILKDYITSCTYEIQHDGIPNLTVNLRKSGQMNFSVKSDLEFQLLREKFKKNQPIYVELRVK